jgi:hypothetical protein
LEQCPLPSPSSDPTDQAFAAPKNPNKEGWDRAVVLLKAAGQMKESQARAFFGKLLSTNQLEARDLLPSVVKAEGQATPDPQAYLTAAAKGVATEASRGLRRPVPGTLIAWSISRNGRAGSQLSQ